ncbi:XkdX family protein [Pediococcus acidilactici]|uniref:XkdX family protein n=1 Tax=Pediococcus acidilactici TaxID=1254 RepID=UPI0019149F71|nr:XkdX family protein [Pediococcus acidilactici]QQP83939.1 XkdX family protein [Pediococcus acidilactici]
MKFPNYNAVKSWYNTTPKLWTNDMVAEAVKYGNITADQYKKITGEDYVAPES